MSPSDRLLLIDKLFEFAEAYEARVHFEYVPLTKMWSFLLQTHHKVTSHLGRYPVEAIYHGLKEWRAV